MTKKKTGEAGSDKLQQAEDLLRRLLGWAANTGGWDAKVWRDAEAYFQTEVEQIENVAIELGLDAEDLDEVVHDLAQEVALDELNTLEKQDDQEEHVSEREAFASDINNGGLADQIEFLLQHNSADEVRKLLNDIAAGKERG
jgi:hypothetical protein